MTKTDINAIRSLILYGKATIPNTKAGEATLGRLVDMEVVDNIIENKALGAFEICIPNTFVIK